MTESKVTLLNGDCLELMKTLPDKSIDCFVCDLPYGQLTQGFARKNHNEEIKRKVSKQTADCCAWDIKINLEEFWTQVKRLAKDDHTPVLMFCNTKFGYELIKSNESWYRYDLVWDKGYGVSFLLANKQPMKSHEMIYVFSKKGSYYKRIDKKVEGKKTWVDDMRNKKDIVSHQYGIARPTGIRTGGKDGLRCPLSVISVDLIKTGEHPTQKPKELYRWLLERYCPEGGTVLDPTAGSFNSILVAKELGLHAIGIEKDETFFKKAQSKFVTEVLETPTNEVVYETND